MRSIHVDLNLSGGGRSASSDSVAPGSYVISSSGAGRQRCKYPEEITLASLRPEEYHDARPSPSLYRPQHPCPDASARTVDGAWSFSRK